MRRGALWSGTFRPSSGLTEFICGGEASRAHDITNLHEAIVGSNVHIDGVHAVLSLPRKGRNPSVQGIQLEDVDVHHLDS
jgi:hypothetical protein